ncbi:hypothetical protein ACVWZ6_006223 [Bradyrhizobium sp. GM6.1]
MAHVLAQEDTDRIGLLAGGAAEHPDANLLARVLAFEELRDDLVLQHLEFTLVAEEFGDADQEVVEEVLRLVLVVAQEIDVSGNVADLDHLHPPLHATQEGVLLVAVEIIAGLAAQDVGDARQRGRCSGQHLIEPLLLLQPPQMTGIDLDVLGDVFGGQHVVGDRRRRIGVLQMIRVVARAFFGDGKAAVVLQCRGTQRAIAADAGQDHADRLLGAFFRQRHQEAVDRRPLAGRLLGRADAEATVLDRRDHRRRAQINRATLDGLAVADVGNLATVGISHDLAQPRLVEGLMMLECEHDGLVGAYGQPGKEPLDAIQSCRRGAHPDDQRRPGLALSFDRLVADFMHGLGSSHSLTGTRGRPLAANSRIDIIPTGARRKRHAAFRTASIGH